ncbi:MAG: APC family permease [Imperialibacter sp.]|uniref:APC family permease n=1 Tax=Imperialibacter sp. TaxID=2038411 RepID=UPI0032EB518A
MSSSSTINRAALRKGIGRAGFFCLAFGAMIGVGWVTAMGPWLQTAGPMGAAIAFAIGGLLMLFIGFCYAEVTAMLPVSGGEVAYAYKAFGTSKSFLVGWFLSFGYLSVSAFEAISVGKILSYLFPAIDKWPLYAINGETIFGSHLLLAFVFVALITWINYVGVQNSIRFQVYLTIVFLLIVVSVGAIGFWEGQVSNLQPLFAQGADNTVIGGIIAVFATVPFWLVGFDTIPQGAEEAKDSVTPRMIGILILVSIVAAVLFYILLIFSTSMVTDWPSIVGSDLFTAKAFELAFQSKFLVNGILVAILIGLLTSWNGFFLAGSRVLFAMGRGKIIAPAMGKSHEKYKTPYNAVLFSGIITFISALLGRGAMIAFVDVGSLCIAAAFLGVSLSYLRLKTAFPHQSRPFLAPGGKLTGYIAMVGSLLILLAITLPNSPAALKWPLEWAILLALSILGTIFWTVSKQSREATSLEERDYLILERFK